MIFKFKELNPDLSKRQDECAKIRAKYPDRLPIICEKDPKSKIKEIEKTKYLVPNDLTVSQFSLLIRKRLEMNKESALFLLVGGKHSLGGDMLINEVYQRHKDPEDGFLYMTYASELTWGSPCHVCDLFIIRKDGIPKSLFIICLVELIIELRKIPNMQSVLEIRI